MVENNDYYPFGMLHNYTATTQNAYQYKFNGKELQESGMYDFGARMYMSDLGRWGVIDPLAESYRRWSPYHYAMDNPINLTDPDGMGSYDSEGVWHSEMEDFNNFHHLGSEYRQQDLAIKRDESLGNGGGGITIGDLMDALFPNSGENYQPNFEQFDFGQFGADDCCPDDPKPKSNKEITPFELGVEWLTGTGPRHRNFTNGDLMTEMLRKHSHVENTRQIILYNVLHGQELSGKNSYQLGGVKGVGLYLKDYSTLLTGGLTGNLAVTFLGSYTLNWTAIPNYRNHTVTVRFSVENSSTMQSASRPPVLGYLPAWQNTAGKYINEKFKSGWGSKTTQTLIWTEILKMKQW
nr:RHS repeat-associated core domain-containing protein [Chryseobacterium daecheongense]